MMKNVRPDADIGVAEVFVRSSDHRGGGGTDRFSGPCKDPERGAVKVGRVKTGVT